jgi:single-strand DNA-binding protein
MNSITVSGTLGRDAEVRYLNSGDAICSFSVADSAGRDKPTIWWNCSLFGKRAEALSQYLTKGQSVTVVGSITEREFTDKNGNHRKSMDVRVNEIALQGGRREPQEERRNNENEQQRQQSFEDDGSDVPF